MNNLVQEMLRGNRVALAKVITKIENDALTELEKENIFERCGHAQVIGITGSPGAGKSSLVNQLIANYRELGKTVGVIAIDPSSYFTGGAFLGDRIRMGEYYKDEHVFIRSLGTRGHSGGLSHSASEAAKVLDAYGFDIVIIETVGVGQIEIDIVHVADTVALVLTPNAGDTIQVMKAGIMEIADIYLVNKADLSGASMIATEVKKLIHLSEKRDWEPKVVLTSALNNENISGAVDAMNQHWKWLQNSGELKRRRTGQMLTDIKRIIAEKVDLFIESEFDSANELNRIGLQL